MCWVVVDNKNARVYMITAATADSEEVIKGNIKNHVRKGGWSQQRYERRRDKELLLYAKEIIAALKDLARTETYRRIVMVGGKEILRIIYENMPKELHHMADGKALDLHKDEDLIHKDIQEIIVQQERRSEHDLWEKIRTEYLKGNLGIVGLNDVLSATRDGRVETIVVERNYKPMGRRCRDCEHLMPGDIATCERCHSESLFPVDIVNEIVELVELTGAEIDFVEPVDTLSEAGHIAALLRYSY